MAVFLNVFTANASVSDAGADEKSYPMTEEKTTKQGVFFKEVGFQKKPSCTNISLQKLVISKSRTFKIANSLRSNSAILAEVLGFEIYTIFDLGYSQQEGFYL